MRRRPTLVIYAKAPHLGTVKRRLAAGIGDLAALRFYRACTGALLRRLARDPRWRTVLALTPDRAATGRRFWPTRVERVPQGRGDLGQRMARSLRRERGMTVIVGSDIPAIDGKHIAAAFRRLAACDLVFGPATDGGYWLVGARGGLPHGLFRDVRWSAERTLADTLAGVPRHRRVGFVAELDDVDDAAAWRRWLSVSSNAPGDAA
jgi:rSAM/selenodomain-associated transferase 1